MKRHPEFRTRLINYLAEAEGRPFEYGVNDCALFAAGAIEAMTGENPAAGWIGKYKTEEGAAKALLKAGFKSVGEVVASLFEEVDPRSARVGDLMLVDIAEAGEVVGISIGPQIATASGRVPSLWAKRAFRV